jgi:ferredoxin
MRSSALTKIRIVFSVLALLLISSLFLDIKHLIPSRYFNLILFFQLIPSANKFISAGEMLATGFVVVMILTVLSGRTYCSFLCPLGLLQDVFSRIGGRIKKKFRRFGYKRPHNILRYCILIVALVVTLVWGIYFLTFLDPYSIFGRSMTYFGKPIVLVINNFFSHILGKFDIYTLVNTPVSKIPLLVYAIPAAFLLLVGIMSLTRGRLYCNTVCPVGTILGLLSKVSVLRIKFDDVKCTRCGRCAIACKSSCIDFLNKDVDHSRCVDCFNCLKSCPDKAIKYGLISMKKKENTLSDEPETDEGKRKVISGALLLFFGFSMRSAGQNKITPVPKKASTVKEKKTSNICPPGSASISNFTSNCTACSLCINICPNNVLLPSYREFGLMNIMQPHMDYHKGFCAYECVKCLEICPTGALLPLSIDAKKLTQIGKAIFVKDNCIVNTEKTSCGACAESCPTKAVHMVPFEGKLVIPVTTDEICIGCGHCEFACPTTPYKAIFVNGNLKHEAAKKPVNVQTDLKKPEEFPF